MFSDFLPAHSIKTIKNAAFKLSSVSSIYSGLHKVTGGHKKNRNNNFSEILEG